MRDNLPEEEFDKLSGKKTTPKIVSLLEMIRKIQQSQNNR